MPNLGTTVVPDIMHYESDIWAIADDLLAASIKQSDFPAYMMPFFALAMLEGRMINAVKKVEEEEGINAKDDPEDFKEAFLAEDCGYNEFIVMKGKTLKAICSNDTSFDQDFANYINAFDADLKRLLGIGCGTGEEKYLNMDGIVAELRGKKILMTVVSKWANIDLSQYDNSAITTLEEHIKRKWADISASTAGEQYTPDDIISLIAEIVAAKVEKPKESYIHVYDPTCGGANLLFGVADRLDKQAGYHNVATYGSEYNSALYALAAIESRFRDHSRIEYGNTLTRVPFSEYNFDVVVANPPYGTKWSGYKDSIDADQTGQFFGGKPAINDGQLLFMQHILWQLDEKGIAVEVHNGSTLFTGDAGSGESNIRKAIFDRDWVEAIIQMPQQEFFNTGIYTYLWIMNKNKATSHKDKVLLIDGSNGWKPLKKSKGDKRREMADDHRKAIVDALLKFEDSPISKLYDREYFYYNKQNLILTEVDDNGKFIQENDEASFTPKSIIVDGKNMDDLKDLVPEKAKNVIDQLKAIDITEQNVIIEDPNGVKYTFNPDKNTIVRSAQNSSTEEIGYGQFSFSLGASKGTKFVKVVIEPAYTSDYEIIPHHFDEEKNKAEINAFMAKYVFKPFVLKDNIIGVELNFNKEFYIPEKLAPVEDILKDIEDLEKELKKIEL